MSNYSEEYFDDSIKWYINESVLSSELPFFTEVYTVFTAETPGVLEYNTYEDLVNNSGFDKAQVPAFSVERPSIDEIVLTCEYPVSSPTINSLALMTVIGDKSYLIAKIIRDSDSKIIPSGIDRIFKFKIPYKELGDLKVYPNISLRLRRSQNSPIGEEFVTTGEHHHNVDWGGAEHRDTAPVLSSSSARFVASAEYNKQDGYSGNSFVFNEGGTLPNNSSEIASITGKLTDLNRADLSENTQEDPIVSRILEGVLANVMEEYLMATNSIQILGHDIPTETSIDSTNAQYVLFTDKVAAGNDRHLKAISSDDFRNWLVKRYTFNSNSSSTTCTSTACVTLINTSVNITVVLPKRSQIAIVINSDSSNINNNHNITYGNTLQTLPPKEALVIFKNDDGSSYYAVKMGSTDFLQKVLKGEVAFKKVAFSTTAGSTSVLQNSYISATNSGVEAKVQSITGVNSFDADSLTVSNALNVGTSSSRALVKMYSKISDDASDGSIYDLGSYSFSSESYSDTKITADDGVVSLNIGNVPDNSVVLGYDRTHFKKKVSSSDGFYIYSS